MSLMLLQSRHGAAKLSLYCVTHDPGESNYKHTARMATTPVEVITGVSPFPNRKAQKSV
jgi:hypothetical protein